MRLEELLEMAFRRGCGISMQEAEALPWFSNVLASCSDHPYPMDAARVSMLGKLLIETAFDCLPEAVQEFAKAWPDMPAEEQLETLKSMCDLLKSDRWYGHREQERPEEYKQTASDVLPLEFGPWETGPVCPSCMGMGTLLMAFAKRTGAPHWLAHVLKSVMFEIQTLDFDITQAVTRYLKRRLPELADAGGLNYLDKLCGEMLDAIVRLNRYNFHPSMVIQLKDQRWVLADPYFGTVAVLEEPDWQVSEAVGILSQPGTSAGTVLMANRKAVGAYRKQLGDESGHLAGFVDTIMEQVVGQSCDASTLAATVQVLRTLVEHESLLWMKPLLEGITNEQLYAQGMFEDGADVDSDMAREGLDRLEADPQYALLAVEADRDRSEGSWFYSTGLR